MHITYILYDRDRDSADDHHTLCCCCTQWQWATVACGQWINNNSAWLCGWPPAAAAAANAWKQQRRHYDHYHRQQRFLLGGDNWKRANNNSTTHEKPTFSPPPMANYHSQRQFRLLRPPLPLFIHPSTHDLSKLDRAAPAIALVTYPKLLLLL